MKKNYFSRLWLLTIFFCMAITSQALTIDIEGHTPIGTFQYSPLFYVTANTITVSSFNSSGSDLFNAVYIDGTEVAYKSSSNWHSYTLDITPYLDGEIHKLQLMFRSSNRGTCYITSNKDYKERFVDGIYYSIEDETAKVIGALPNIKNAIIHETYTMDGVTYPVVAIASNVFRNSSDLKSVTIGNNVESIGVSAFEGCSGLTSVTIGNSVTSIGNYAFYNCRGLTSVTIPNSVKSIGVSAFEGCSGLTSVTIGSSVTSIGSEAFRICSNLNKVIVSDLAAWCSISFADSDSNPLYYAHLYSDEETEITDLIIPNGVTSIGNYAFYNCRGLTSVTIPNSVTSIGSEAFDGCTGLTSVTIPNSVESIGERAFFDCSSLTSVTIPNSVKSIGNSAFFDCSSLTSVTIPNSVESIGERAFAYCKGLTSIIIPNSVTSIGKEAFYGCSIIKAFWLGNTPPSGYSNVGAEVHYVSNNQYSMSNQLQYPFLSSMFTVDGTVYVPVSPSDRTCDVVDCIYSDENKDVTISSKVINKGVEMSVIDIKPYAFYNNDYIQSLNLSNAGQIGSYAFYGCDSLISLQTANAGNIGSRAFYSCSNLQTANIENAGNIGSSAFYDCNNLQTAQIGGKITGISSSAFEGCSTLREIIIPNSVTSLGTSAFKDCSSLESVSIGREVPSLPGSVFEGCSSLASLSIPNNISSIGDNAFRNCSSLSDVIIEDAENSDDILVLGSNGSWSSSSPLFSDCPLDEVYIGRKLSYQTSSSYGYSPFYRNTSLRTVEITDAETEIYDNEFYGCSNLKSLKIGNGVTTIGNWAFSGCSSLDYFSAGSHVESIGKEAFSDCTGLTKYYSYSVVPPTCGDQALDDINKWECTLYVPNESSDEYQAASQWKDFFFVEEMDDAADIRDMESDASTISIEAKDGVITVKGKRPQDLVSVYNSQGAPVGVTTDDTITLLQHGVFIVRIGNYTRKIIL